MAAERKSILINKSLYQDIHDILDNRRKQLMNEMEDFQIQVENETDDDWRLAFNYGLVGCRKDYAKITDMIVNFEYAYKKGYRV